MAVALAALGAFFMGLAGAAQHHAAQQVPRRPGLHPGLILALAQRPWWVLGSVASAAGLVLQAAALTVGSIVVVQTVVISSLAWTAVVESLLAGRRPTWRVVAGVGLVVAGVAGLLLALAPRVPPDVPPPTPAAVGVVVGGWAVLTAAGLLWGLRGTGRARALGLALATGVTYGLTAALLKLAGAQARHGGWAAPLHHPALYAVVLLGPVAVLFSQHTLQRGRMASLVLAVVVLVDPLAGVAAGVLWFGERLATGPVALVAAAAGLAAAVAGVVVAQTSGPGGATTADMTRGRSRRGDRRRRPSHA